MKARRQLLVLVNKETKNCQIIDTHVAMTDDPRVSRKREQWKRAENWNSNMYD